MTALTIRIDNVVIILSEDDGIGIFVNESTKEAITMSLEQVEAFIGGVAMGYNFDTVLAIVTAMGEIPQPMKLDDAIMASYHAMMAEATPLGAQEAQPRVNTMGNTDVN